MDEGCTLLVASVSITARTISPHQALRASFPLRGKPCIEPSSERVTVLYKIPRLTLGMTGTVFLKLSSILHSTFYILHSGMRSFGAHGYAVLTQDDKGKCVGRE